MQGACQALPEERQRGCLLPAGADPMDGFPGMQTNQERAPGLENRYGVCFFRRRLCQENRKVE